MKSKSQMPKYYDLMNPLLEALHELGRSGYCSWSDRGIRKIEASSYE